MGEVSRFFIQYKDSPPHWKILTDDDYNYIVQFVYTTKKQIRYYSVVNVSGKSDLMFKIYIYICSVL